MKKILYITYADIDNPKSGSGVRPQKMYKAFLDMGYDVKILKGVASKEKKAQRINNIMEVEQWLKNNKPDYCYIESPGDPIIFKEDRQLIKHIHKLGIKIGYFYRDAYYKIGKSYILNDNKINLKKYLRFYYYKVLFNRDDILINKNVDVVFFPSETMISYFNFKNMKTLPPAGEIIDYKRRKNNNVIYVGGINERYGINILLETMEIVNQSQQINLILVCRKNEMSNINEKYINCDWLKIYNVSGTEALKELYENASIGLFPLKKDKYNNMAISVKLFEYMSYGIPIVAINTLEPSKIIEKYDLGILVEENAQEMADAILKLFSDCNLYEKYRKNVEDALKAGNLWTDRVKRIEEFLINQEKL